jgi:hypothetical protein
MLLKPFNAEKLIPYWSFVFPKGGQRAPKRTVAGNVHEGLSG